jgi:hypothetical protein
MDKKEIEKIIENLWLIEAEEWVNYITVDSDGEVWGFETYPYTDNNSGGRWLENTDNKSKNWAVFLTDVGGNCPNWRELIFQRPLSLPLSSPTTENQLTPLLQRLRDYLDNTPRQQIEADWTQVKSLGLHGSPNCDEFIKTFKR